MTFRPSSLLLLLLACFLSPSTTADALTLGGIFGGPTRASGSAAYWNAASLAELEAPWGAMLDLSLLHFDVSYLREGYDPRTGEPFGTTSFDTLAPNPGFTLCAPTPWPWLRIVSGGFTPATMFVRWEDDGPQRFHATESGLVTYAVTLGLLWRPSSRYGLTAAVGPVYGVLDLGYHLDFGAYANGLLPPGSQLLPLEDPQLEGRVDIQTSGWGLIGVVGAWARPLDWLRLGANLAMPSALALEGTFGLESTEALEQALPGFELATVGDIELDYPMYWEAHAEAEVMLGDLSFAIMGLVLPAPHSRTIIAHVENAGVDFVNGMHVSVNDTRHDWLVGARLGYRFDEAWELGARVDVDPRSIPDEIVHPGNMDFTSVHTGGGLRWRFAEGMFCDLAYTYMYMKSFKVESSVLNPYAPPDSGLAMPSGNGVYDAEAHSISMGIAGTFGE